MIINGLYGTSSFVFLVFKWSYEADITLRSIFIFYTILSSFCFMRTFMFMPKKSIPFNIPSDYKFGYMGFGF
jgi:hypothetical protein